MKRTLSSFLLAGVLLVGAFNTSTVHAESSTIDLSSIKTLSEAELEKNTFPGTTVLVKKGDVTLYHESFGYAQLFDMGTRYEKPIQTSNETIYDLASVTKVMATTQALMMLTYEGKVDLDLPVANYMPEFAQNGKENVTVRDLLTHTSGLTPWKPTFLYVNTREGEKAYVNALPLEYPTGSAMKYSDFSFMSLAFMVESIVNQPIEEYLQENMYGPLGLKDTGYVPLKNNVDKSRIAATSWGNPYEWRMSNEAEYPGYGYDTSADADAFKAFTGWRNHTLIGEVNDGNAGMANEGVAGHAGLFSTTSDLSIIGDVLLNGGSVDGITFYDQKTIDEFIAADPNRFGRGLGWQVNGNAETRGYVGKYATDAVFSHAGFTGTQVIFDSEYDLQVIILTNKQNSGHDNGNYKSPYAYSRAIMNLVYENINEDISKVDKTKLSEVIDTGNAIDKTKLSNNDVIVLEKGIENAQGVFNGEKKIQEEVDNAVVTLQKIIDSLSVITVQKDQLELMISKAETYQFESISVELRTEFNETLSKAKEIFSDVSVTQEEVDLITKQLQDVIEKVEVEISKIPDEKTPADDKGKESTLPSTGIEASSFGFLAAISSIGIGSGIVFRKRLRK